MIQVDLPMALGVGSLMAYGARQQIASGPPVAAARAFTRVLIFHAVAFMWPPLYLLVFYFGFETSHMWWHGDSVLDYPWLLPAFFLALFTANVVGYRLGARFVRAGRARRSLVLFAAMALFTMIWIVSMPDRTMTLGTYREWAEGTAPPASSDPAFLAFVTVVLVGYSAGAAWVYRSLRREGAAMAAAPRTSTSSVQ